MSVGPRTGLRVHPRIHPRIHPRVHPRVHPRAGPGVGRRSAAGIAVATAAAIVAMLAGAALTACSEVAQLPVAAGTGAQPALPQPKHSLIPTVDIAPAIGWAPGATPLAAAGLRVTAFATGLDHPRWLYVLPNGDVLVAETNAPPKPDDGHGIKGWFMGLAMKRAGAAAPSANRISLLRDTQGSGVADRRSVLLEGLTSPFGMTLVGGDLYVADSDAILRFPYVAGDTQIRAAGVTVVPLPAGAINHHWTKNVIASADGSKLYVTVGSNSNVGERGMGAEEGRAAIWEVDLSKGRHRIFASGLRNPNGMAWEPDSGALWAVVNERDEIGSDLVPDYMTAVHDGAFYGWPFSYYGQHVDTRVQPPQPQRVAAAIAPDYALGPHTASLGLAWSAGTSLPAAYQNGMFIGQHGSWNRRPPSGYKVIFVPFAGGQPSGPPRDVLTGFLSDKGSAYGRPVGVVVARDGALLVADDVGNVVWRVSGAGASAVLESAPDLRAKNPLTPSSVTPDSITPKSSTPNSGTPNSSTPNSSTPSSSIPGSLTVSLLTSSSLNSSSLTSSSLTSSSLTSSSLTSGPLISNSLLSSSLTSKSLPSNSPNSNSLISSSLTSTSLTSNSLLSTSPVSSFLLSPLAPSLLTARPLTPQSVTPNSSALN